MRSHQLVVPYDLMSCILHIYRSRRVVHITHARQQRYQAGLQVSRSAHSVTHRRSRRCRRRLGSELTSYPHAVSYVLVDISRAALMADG